MHVLEDTFNVAGWFWVIEFPLFELFQGFVGKAQVSFALVTVFVEIISAGDFEFGISLWKYKTTIIHCSQPAFLSPTHDSDHGKENEQFHFRFWGFWTSNKINKLNDEALHAPPL
jgi:hypothetical protein